MKAISPSREVLATAPGAGLTMAVYGADPRPRRSQRLTLGLTPGPEVIRRLRSGEPAALVAVALDELNQWLRVG
jgi:hypothetical protein